MKYWATVLADSPIRLYKLNETSGTTFTDSGSQAVNGTKNGTITLNQTSLLRNVPGNGCILLDGSTGYVSAATTGLPSGSQSWSLECWVKQSSVPSSGIHGILEFGTGATNEAAVIYQNTNSIRANTYSGNDTTGFVPTANTVYYLCATYDGTNLRFYMNATQQGSAVACTPSVTLSYFRIGSEDSPVDDYWGGYIQGAAAYSSALSATQISNHYHAGLAIATLTDGFGGVFL